MSTPVTPDRTTPPPLPPLPPPRLPKLQSRKLANGLELDLVEMHAVPVVDVSLIVRAGAARDPADLPGLATFTANMLDEGAGKRSALEISDEIDFLGASLSTSAGLETGQIKLHVPKGRLGAALDVMADVALRPAFPDSEVERQRELRRAGLLRLRDQPTSIAPIAFNAVVFGATHPYGWPAGGTDSSTALLTRARVAEFYARYYHPGGSKLLVVGDVTLDEAVALIQPRFGSWSGGDSPPAANAPSPPAPARAFYLVDKPGAPQSVIRIGNVGAPRSTPDYHALAVLNTLLGGSYTSRLNQNLRETHGYTYSASSVFEMRRLPGPFRAGASVATTKTDSAVVEFLKELRRVRDERVPAEELDKTKAFLTLGVAGDFETTGAAADRFADLLANDLPVDSWDHYVAGIQAVTAEDLQRVARRYIDPDHFVMLIVGDRKAIEPGLRALAEGDVNVRDLWGAGPRP